jgi:hypothetical protein
MALGCNTWFQLYERHADGWRISASSFTRVGERRKSPAPETGGNGESSHLTIPRSRIALPYAAAGDYGPGPIARRDSITAGCSAKLGIAQNPAPMAEGLSDRDITQVCVSTVSIVCAPRRAPALDWRAIKAERLNLPLLAGLGGPSGCCFPSGRSLGGPN